jgi:hypothetical protein
MKITFRLALLVALVAMLAFAPALNVVRAQDCPPGLSAEDCALLAKINTPTEMASSFKIEGFSINIAVTGAPTGDLSLDVTGSGALDTSKVDSAALSGGDTAALIKGLIFQLAMNAALKQGGSDQAGDLEIRIVGGEVYLKGAMVTGGRWFKLPPEQLAGAAGGGLPVDPGMAQGLAENPAIVGALTQLFSSIPSAVTYSAAGGPTVGGKATRAITTSVNLEAIVKGLFAAGNRDALKSLLGALGAGPVDDAQLAQLDQIVVLLEPTLKATKIEFTVYGEPTEGKFAGFALVIQTTVDQTLAGLLGGTNPISVSVKAEVKVAEMGQPVTVEAPADAVTPPGSN